MKSVQYCDGDLNNCHLASVKLLISDMCGVIFY